MIRRQLSQFELARNLLWAISIEKHISRRVNMGAVNLSLGDVDDFAYQGSSSDFVIELLLLAGIYFQHFPDRLIGLDLDGIS
jgi:hypothetical protein